MFKVYLAGPITGTSYDDCTDWRESVSNILEDSTDQKIVCYSPMRGKEFLKDEENVEDCYELSAIASSRGIITRDYNDCKTSDLILVNLLNAKRVSIGTVMEIAWAKAFQIPVICVIDIGNPHSHSFIDECVGFKVDNLQDAMYIAKVVLLDK